MKKIIYIVLVLLLILVLYEAEVTNISAIDLSNGKLFVEVEGETIKELDESVNMHILQDIEDMYLVIQLHNPGNELKMSQEEYRIDKDKNVYRKNIQSIFEKNNSKISKYIMNKYNIEVDDMYVSNFTPFIYIDVNGYEGYLKMAIDISKKTEVERVVIYENPEIEVPEFDLCMIGPDGNCVSPPPPPPPVENRRDDYDNFPTGTQYTGDNIRIGLLDTGFFNENHVNFDDIYVETVVDTHVTANENDHPDRVASVMGGEFGIASSASIYYADVNSGVGYINIEDLLQENVDIINMSISTGSCRNNGTYDSVDEAYLDYIVNTELVILVAAAGNTLNKLNSGGFVCQPGNSSNIISVGSIDINGNPSEFSSYNNNNDVANNPMISAVGEARIVDGWGPINGTSYSAPAVSGTIALLLEKHGSLSAYSVATILTATSNNSIIGTASEVVDLVIPDPLNPGNWIDSGFNLNVPPNTYDDSIGFNPRTGSGALDMTAALNYNGPIIDYCITGLANNETETIVNVYLTAGQNITVSLAWERIANYNPGTSVEYTLDDIADLSIRVIDDMAEVAFQTSVVEATHEMVRFSAPSNGWYLIEIQALSDASDIANFSYSYVIGS